MNKSMKTILLSLCLVILTACLGIATMAEESVTTTVGDIIVPGNGTVANPYLISTEEQLLLIANGSLPNALTSRYRLQNDITVTAESWQPIGLTTNAPFAGSFYGNGYTISGIVINTGYSHSGFFGVNVGYINGMRVDVTINSGGCSGGLAGRNDGTILDCVSSGTVTSTGNQVGGLVGLNFSGNISCSGSTATVSGKDNVGGLVGQHQGYYSNQVTLINDCYAQGNVTGNTNTGGLVGRMYETNNIKPVVENCYASGIVNNGNGGGLLGSGYGTYYNSYYNTFNTGNRRGFGVQLEELKEKSTFYLWDFEHKWTMNDGFPYIRYTAGTSDSPILDGAGTIEDPYLVRNEKDLRMVQGGKTSDRIYYYLLVNDIELTAKYWTPLNVYGEFEGVFNGNGHTISGLQFSTADYDAAGLFGYNNGTIKNLTVSGNIQGTSKAGMLTGENRGTIENCFSSGTVTSTGNEVGGLVGLNFSGRIRYSGSTATVSGNEYVGGLVGQHQGYYSNQVALINDCYAQGNVIGGTNAGGLVGHMYEVYNQQPIIRDCYASGIVNNGQGCGLVGSGYNHGRYYNSYYHSFNAGNQIGYSVSLEELTQKNTFYQWNFDTVWAIDNGYPYIQLQDGDKSVTFEGNGTEEFPYLIKTEKQLLAMATERIDIENEVYYQLENDISLTAKYWTPIGAFVNFKGVFDGQGHTISNVRHSQSSISNVGFFGINEGTIKNLTVTGDIRGNGNTGLLAASNYGWIENCLSYGTVENNAENTGGLVGYNNSGTIHTSGSFANVSGQNNVGGLVGRSYGYYSSNEITNCFAHGTVSGNSKIGGLIGYHDQYYGNFTLQYNYAIGQVSGNSWVNGFLGEYSYNGTATICDNYYNTETSDCTDTMGATPKTTLEMKTKETYQGWNFDTIWAISKNTLDGYPFLENVVKAEDNSMDASGISFWLTLNGNTNTGTVYAGIYEENGTLKHLKEFPAQKIVNIMFDKGMTGSYVKIMWWNDLEPMCNAQTIPLQ